VAKAVAVLPAPLETAVPAALFPSRGRLTFDADLLRQPGAFRAEVIAHELLHLKVPNHSKVFRALLRAHLRYPPLEKCAR
jgi:predicted metal-dependent hydrolase